MRNRLAFTISGFIAIAVVLFAQTVASAAPPPEVRDAVASPGERVAAAYVTVTVTEADTLLGVSADVAEATMHRTEVSDGTARMRPVERMAVPPGGELRFEPGGSHIMLEGLVTPLEVGDRFELRLKFQRAGEQVVSVEVVSDAEISSRQPAVTTGSTTSDSSGGLGQSTVQLLGGAFALIFVLVGGGAMWFGMKRSGAT